jgi:hypothetical protein
MAKASPAITATDLQDLPNSLPKRKRAEAQQLIKELASQLPSQPTTLNPLEFAVKWLNANPAPYQAEILNALVAHRRVAVRGPHGLGKTALASWVALWALCTFGDDCKVITTASVWRQLSKFLWPEIRKWGLKLKARIPALEILQESARLGQAEAFAVASDNPAYIEGAHAKKLIYILDEAKAIPPATWDAIEGAFSTGEVYCLAISTPGDRAGRFFDIHRRAHGFEDWWVRHVTLAEAIVSGRISQEWADARLAQWGADSPVYQARVLGEFPQQSDDVLISLAWIEAAIERGLAMLENETPIPPGPHVSGQDVARYGSDDSANAVRYGNVVVALETWHGNDTMQTTGKAKLIGQTHGAILNIDEVGVGAGVTDRLREMNVANIGVNVGERANDPEHFVNLRSEAYWALRQRFVKGEIAIAIADRALTDRLTGELTGMHYKVNSKGQLVLETKEDMRKRGLPSPDLADAVMLAFCYSGGGDATAWLAALDKSVETFSAPAVIVPTTARNPWLDAMDRDEATQTAPWFGPEARRIA